MREIAIRPEYPADVVPFECVPMRPDHEAWWADDFLVPHKIFYFIHRIVKASHFPVHLKFLIVKVHHFIHFHNPLRVIEKRAPLESSFGISLSVGRKSKTSSQK